MYEWEQRHRADARDEGNEGNGPLPGRRPYVGSLARGRCRARVADARRPSPDRPATGDPPLRTTRHRAMQLTAAGRSHTTSDQSRKSAAHAELGSPLNRRHDYPGGDSGPVKGAPSARRDGASATLDRTWPRVPRTS